MKRALGFLVMAGLMMGCATVGRKTGPSDIEGATKGETAMATMYASRTLSVSIRCHPNQVYEFVSNPENLPRWAKGLAESVRKQGAEWIVETSQGPAKVRFAERNIFGILDHHVTTASGVEVYVPMRVLSNGSGSEVIFTLFRLPEMSDEKHAEDAKLVERDLRSLKDILEK